MEGFIERETQQIRERVGDQHVVCGLSGGVDSAVVALLMHRAIGERLTCVFVDNGLLRKDEAAQVVNDLFWPGFESSSCGCNGAVSEETGQC